MKIMVLSSHTPSLMWFRLDMMLDFLKCGCQVIAVGNEEESIWSNQFENHGIRYRQVNIQRNGMNPLNDLKTLKSIRTVLKEEKPDKIFAYNAKTVIYGGIAAKKEKVETYSLIAGLGSVFMAKGIKNTIIQYILEFDYRKSLKHSKTVFFQNKDDVDIFTKKKMVEADKITMINGSGVNLERFKAQPLPEKIGFLFIGRLIRDKGIYEYLEACKIVKEKYPEVRCLLVGPFDSNPSAIKKEDLQPFIDNGFIEYFGEQRDVRPFLAQCSVFVLPSYREGTPKSVLEAMASYKAVITTNAPGCKETVKDGENGFLVPIKDARALAEKMLFLYENQHLIEVMASDGRRKAEQIFDVKKINNIIISKMELKENQN